MGGSDGLHIVSRRRYEDDGGTILIGDVPIAAGSDQAWEIRKLR